MSRICGTASLEFGGWIQGGIRGGLLCAWEQRHSLFEDLKEGIFNFFQMGI